MRDFLIENADMTYVQTKLMWFMIEEVSCSSYGLHAWFVKHAQDGIFMALVKQSLCSLLS